MLYERSLTIENRLLTVLELIETGDYATHDLAEELGVSIPTISRDVTALRQRGYDIHAEREGTTWRYVLFSVPTKKQAGGIRPSRRLPR